MREPPVGFRFLPTDEELVEYYLTNRVYNKPLLPNLIHDIHANEFYTNHPQHLLISSTGESECFFFIRGDDSAEEPRMIEGGTGFWKPGGDESPLYDSDGNIFAFKIYWTYFSGSPRKPKKTHWRMEQFRLLPHCLQGENLVLGRIRRSQNYRCR